MTGIDFTSDLERELYDKARIGIEATDFLNSPVGKYVRQRALDERHDIVEELLNTNPSLTNRIEQLQRDALMAICAIEWLAEAIEEGNQAEQELDA